MGFRLSLALLLLLPLVAHGKNEISWEINEISLPAEVRIEENESSDFDTLKLPEGEVVYLEKYPTTSSDYSGYKNLSGENKKSIQRIRRDLILSLAKLGIKRKLHGLTLINSNKAVQLAPSAKSINDANLVEFDPIESAIGIRPQNTKIYKNTKFKSFLKMLNEAILLSTYNSVKQHSENRHYIKSLRNEVGIQIVLKAEFQFGMGDFNIIKNFPVTLSLGYKRDTREIILKVGSRAERMDGGTAFSAGVKMELKKYSSISSNDGSISDVGVTWYPPSIPMVSFVGDYSPTTNASGLVFGLNFADLVPGLYFLNTVNNYKDQQMYVKHIKVPNIKSWVSKLFRSFKTFTQSDSKTPSMCSFYLAA